MQLDADPNLGEAQWRQLHSWLEPLNLVMHPGKFDLHVLAIGTDLWPGNAHEDSFRWDTLLAAHELDPGMEASLEQVEHRLRYLTPERRQRWIASKTKRKETNKLEWEEARSYAATDAEVTYAIFQDQVRRFNEGEGDWYGFQLEMRVARALFRLEQRGIGYDAPQSEEIARRILRLEGQIKKGMPYRPTLHGAKKYYYQVLALEPTERTDKGQPKLDDNEVARLVEVGAPHAREFQTLRKLETARSKWYESYASMTGWDGRLRTSFSQAKVISGRLSSTRVNLQAIPHDYQLQEVIDAGLRTPRQLFKPHHGTKLWELDLSQAELRVAAKEAKCASMLDLVKAGADIHGEVAHQLFGTGPGDANWYRDRAIGKRADFSFIFGVGAEEFQASLVRYAGVYLPLGECKSIVFKWRRLYPEYGKTIKQYMTLANHWQYVKLINGRVRHFRTWEEQHKAFNQYVQGSLAELMKAWLVKADELVPNTVLLTIHDSLVLETSSDKAVQMVRSLGEEIGTEWFGVPMVVDLKEWAA